MSILEDLFDSNGNVNEPVPQISTRMRTIVIPTLTAEQEALVEDVQNRIDAVPSGVIFVLGENATTYAGKLAVCRNHNLPKTDAWLHPGGLQFVKLWLGSWRSVTDLKVGVSFGRFATYEDIIRHVVHQPPVLNHPVKNSPDAIFANWVVTTPDDLDRKIRRFNETIRAGGHGLVRAQGSLR